MFMFLKMMCSQSFGSSRNQHFISKFFLWSLQFGVAISENFLKTKKGKFSKFLSLPLPGVPEKRISERKEETVKRAIKLLYIITGCAQKPVVTNIANTLTSHQF